MYLIILLCILFVIEGFIFFHFSRVFSLAYIIISSLYTIYTVIMYAAKTFRNSNSN